MGLGFSFQGWVEGSAQLLKDLRCLPRAQPCSERSLVGPAFAFSGMQEGLLLELGALLLLQAFWLQQIVRTMKTLQ